MTYRSTCMPDIHNCSQLLSDNERLKKTLRRIKHENEDLKRKLNDFEDQRKMEQMLKQFVTTRNMETQTDPVRAYSSHAMLQSQSSQKKVNNTQQQDKEKMNKMLIMHNNLMKRYEKELKANMNNIETITTLNLKVNELEQKLKETEIKHQQLLAGNHSSEKVKKSASRAKKLTQHSSHDVEEDLSSDESDTTPLIYKYRCIRKERDKLLKENKKLKSEIKGLDHGFFEEIEDLKYALQQSALLNQEYEKSCKRMARQFGVPYPNPEKKVLTKRK